MNAKTAACKMQVAVKNAPPLGVEPKSKAPETFVLSIEL